MGNEQSTQKKRQKTNAEKKVENGELNGHAVPTPDVPKPVANKEAAVEQKSETPPVTIAKEPKPPKKEEVDGSKLNGSAHVETTPEQKTAEPPKTAPKTSEDEMNNFFGKMFKKKSEPVKPGLESNDSVDAKITALDLKIDLQSDKVFNHSDQTEMLKDILGEQLKLQLVDGIPTQPNTPTSLTKNILDSSSTNVEALTCLESLPKQEPVAVAEEPVSEEPVTRKVSEMHVGHLKSEEPPTVDANVQEETVGAEQGLLEDKQLRQETVSHVNEMEESEEHFKEMLVIAEKAIIASVEPVLVANEEIAHAVDVKLAVHTVEVLSPVEEPVVGTEESSLVAEEIVDIVEEILHFNQEQETVSDVNEMEESEEHFKETLLIAEKPIITFAEPVLVGDEEIAPPADVKLADDTVEVLSPVEEPVIGTEESSLLAEEIVDIVEEILQLTQEQEAVSDVNEMEESEECFKETLVVAEKPIITFAEPVLVADEEIAPPADVKLAVRTVEVLSPVEEPVVGTEETSLLAEEIVDIVEELLQITQEQEAVSDVNEMEESEEHFMETLVVAEKPIITSVEPVLVSDQEFATAVDVKLADDSIEVLSLVEEPVFGTEESLLVAEEIVDSVEEILHFNQEQETVSDVNEMEESEGHFKETLLIPEKPIITFEEPVLVSDEEIAPPADVKLAVDTVEVLSPVEEPVMGTEEPSLVTEEIVDVVEVIFQVTLEQEIVSHENETEESEELQRSNVKETLVVVDKPLTTSEEPVLVADEEIAPPVDVKLADDTVEVLSPVEEPVVGTDESSLLAEEIVDIVEEILQITQEQETVNDVNETEESEELQRNHVKETLVVAEKPIIASVEPVLVTDEEIAPPANVKLAVDSIEVLSPVEEPVIGTDESSLVTGEIVDIVEEILQITQEQEAVSHVKEMEESEEHF